MDLEHLGLCKWRAFVRFGVVQRFTGTSTKGTIKFAIEMKCYPKISSSGGPRGAQDVFQKDVYEDLQILEHYVDAGIARRGVALVMNDLPSITEPKVKNGKYWAYDISHGVTFPGGTINVDIGGKNVSLSLKHSYSFNWSKFGDIWFTEIEGVAQPNADRNFVDTNPESTGIKIGQMI